MEDDKLIIFFIKKTTHTTQQQLVVVRWLHRLLVGKQLPAELYSASYSITMGWFSMRN